MPCDIKEIKLYRSREPQRGPIFTVDGYIWGEDGERDFIAKARQRYGCNNCDVPNSKKIELDCLRRERGKPLVVITKCESRISRDPRAKCLPQEF